MLVPNQLKPGDQIALVATSKFFPPEHLDHAVVLLKSWGLEPIVASNALSVEHNFAGSLMQRVDSLQTAINDPNIKAIFALRGGYGAIQLIDLVDWTALKHQPKWLIGFSDIGVFHHYLLNALNMLSIHATMPINYKDNTSSSLEGLKDILFKQQRELHLEIPEKDLNCSIEGRMIGGNLSIVYSLLGTSFTYAEQDDFILILEDLTEMRYHMERMLYSIQYASWFKKVKLIMAGHFSNMQEGSVPFGKDELTILKEFAQRNQVPLVTQIPIGHENHNEAFVHGSQTNVFIQNGKLTLKQFIR